MRSASLLAAAVGISLAVTSPPPVMAADTKAECIAAADQGQSLREAGKYLRAREAFSRCASETCPAVVTQSCNRWLHETDEAMPTVVLGAKDETGRDLTHAQVTMDGSLLTDALDGKPLQTDPGQHLFRFTRPDSEPSEAAVVLQAGERNRVVAVTLKASAAGGREPPPPASEGRPGSFFSAPNVTSLSMLVLGGAALGVGAFFASQSGSRSSTAGGLRSSMPSYACTDSPTSAPCQQLSSAVDAQHSDAIAGTAMLIGGAVLVAGAVASWLAWPRDAQPKSGLRLGYPMLEPQAGGARVGLTGAF
jgi:hypothetical protein